MERVPSSADHGGAAVEEGRPHATTASAPVLTIEGQLLEQISKLESQPPAKDWGVPKPLSSYTSNPQYNPDGKSLGLQAEQELARIVAEYDAQALSIANSSSRLSAQALRQAVEHGQIVSHVTAIGGVTMSRDEARRQNEAWAKQAQADLAARLGRQGVDYSVASFGTVGPDHVARTSYIWFTRAQAPGFFDNQERFGDVVDAQVRALKDFFARL